MSCPGRKPENSKHVPGPTGVRGRNSDNRLIQEKLGWAPSAPLRDGLAKTYSWIAAQVEVETTQVAAMIR